MDSSSNQRAAVIGLADCRSVDTPEREPSGRGDRPHKESCMDNPGFIETFGVLSQRARTCAARDDHVRSTGRR
jgi:hypothetical protein